MKTWKRGLAAVLFLAAVGLVLLFWPGRKLAEAKALQKELFSPASRSLSAEQRREKWQQFRKVMERLSPAQRAVLSAESRKRQQAALARYFALSPAGRVRHLDEQIQREEKLRKQRLAQAGRRAGGTGNRTGTGRPLTGPAGQAMGAAGQQTGGRGRSPAARDKSRQNRLDSTSPAERAMFAQYRKELNARRAQLGLSQGRRFGPLR